MKQFPITVVAALALCGCTSPAWMPTYAAMPADTASTCISVCQQIGFPLNAVVVVANRVGCVCLVPGASTSAATGGEAAAAGAIIAAEEEEAARRR